MNAAQRRSDGRSEQGPCGHPQHRRGRGRPAPALLAALLALLLTLGLAPPALAWPLPRPAAPAERTAPGLTTGNGPRTGSLQEVAPPAAVQQLSDALALHQPRVTILEPHQDALLSGDPWTLRLHVEDWPLVDAGALGLGPHLMVQIDDQQAQSLVQTSLVMPPLSPGSHRLTVYAVRPWGEAVKAPGAFAQIRLHRTARNPLALPAAGSPQLLSVSPAMASAAEPILLDWLLIDAPLQNLRADDARWRLRLTVNGDSLLVNQQTPLWLRGWQTGVNAVLLELVDGRGEPLNPPFNSLVREVILDRNAPRPAWQGAALEPADLAALLGEAPTPGRPEPLPERTAAPTPESAPAAGADQVPPGGPEGAAAETPLAAPEVKTDSPAAMTSPEAPVAEASTPADDGQSVTAAKPPKPPSPPEPKAAPLRADPSSSSAGPSGLATTAIPLASGAPEDNSGDGSAIATPKAVDHGSAIDHNATTSQGPAPATEPVPLQNPEETAAAETGSTSPIGDRTTEAADSAKSDSGEALTAAPTAPSEPAEAAGAATTVVEKQDQPAGAGTTAMDPAASAPPPATPDPGPAEAAAVDSAAPPDQAAVALRLRPAREEVNPDGTLIRSEPSGPWQALKKAMSR